MFRELLVLLALTAVASAGMLGAYMQPKPYKFRHLEGCYVSLLDKVIPFGQSETYKPYCQEYRCGKDGASMVTCGSTIVHPPCRLMEDHSKSYPDCCPQPYCP